MEAKSQRYDIRTKINFDASCGQGYLLFQEGGGQSVLGTAHFGEGEQEGERGFRALVLIDAVNVETIPAATALGIIER
jgi:hypothetical protein